MRQLGIVVQPTGPGRNVLKIKPPLCATRDDIDAFAAAVEHTLEAGW